MADSGKYKVVEGSESGHCCFEATVIDTTRPVLCSDGMTINYFERVCECFEMEDAVRIAAALNR